MYKNLSEVIMMSKILPLIIYIYIPIIYIYIKYIYIYIFEIGGLLLDQRSPKLETIS